ncbi:MAG: AraC family transcriptional regulator [Tardiphaga sp.]
MSKLGKNQELRGNGIKFFRKGSDDPRLGQIATEADDRGFVLGASQTDGHRRRFFHGRRVTTQDFGRGTVYVRNLADPYRADLEGTFDFLMLELSRPFLLDLANEHGWRGPDHLAASFGRDDPVLSSLLCAAQPALEKPNNSNRVFVDQLGVAIGIHLFESCGGGAIAPQPRGRPLLSKPQMALTFELLRRDPGGQISIAELAAACGLSRGYFIHAFKSTTGITPYQWVLTQRVEQARELLKNSDLSLAEVALACGFADQSHFTRVFSRLAGASPGSWRRSVRN